MKGEVNLKLISCNKLWVIIQACSLDPSDLISKENCHKLISIIDSYWMIRSNSFTFLYRNGGVGTLYLIVGGKYNNRNGRDLALWWFGDQFGTQGCFLKWSQIEPRFLLHQAPQRRYNRMSLSSNSKWIYIQHEWRWRYRSRWNLERGS